jgi:hypothetical protein
MVNNVNGSLFAIWDHILTPFDPGLSIVKDSYVWDYSNLGGRYFVMLNSLPYHGSVYLLSFALPVGWANTILFWLLFLISGFSMYAFVLRTLKLDEDKKQFVALIASLFYMFNPVWSFNVYGEPLLSFVLAFLPLLMLLAREALISDSIRRTIRYLVLASLITVLMSTADITNTLIVGFFVGAYLIFISIQRRKLKPLIITLSLLFAFSLLANSWWIAPNLMHQTVQGAIHRSPEYVGYVIAGLRVSQPWRTYSNVLRGMGYVISPPAEELVGNPVVTRPPGASMYNTELFVIISTLIAIIAFSSILSRRTRKSSDVLIFALIGVIYIPLILTGINPPFGSFIEWLAKNVPFYVFARSGYNYILQFIYVYMFSLGVLGLYNLVVKAKRAIRLSGQSVITCILVLVVVVNAFPQWLGYTGQTDMYNEEGKLQPVSYLVQAPDYVRDLSNYLNTSTEEGGVLILPMLGTMRAYNWNHGYFGFDVYYLTLKRPVLTQYYGGRRQPNDDVYKFINDSIYRGDSNRFAELLTLLDIKYIIVVEDALRWGSTTFNISQIHQFLSECKDIKFVKRFGEHVLYETTRRPKMFYTVTQSILYDPQQYSIYFEPTDISEKNWVQQLEAPDIIMSLSASSLDLTYVYTENCIQRGWAANTISNNIPFNINSENYEYLYVTLKTPPGIYARINCRGQGVSYARPEPGEALVPMNPNDESRSDVLVSTSDYHTFAFDLQHLNEVDFIDIELRKIDGIPVGNYTASIKGLFFCQYSSLHLTPSVSLSFLLKHEEPTKTALVEDPEGVVSCEENFPTIIEDEINPTSFRIRVLNAKTPFLLGSTINYDNGWVAEVNGDQIEHIEVNGMFNGWIVKETGSFTVEIYYRPQRQAQFFGYISSAFIATACVLLFFLTFKSLIRKLQNVRNTVLSVFSRKILARRRR